MKLLSYIRPTLSWATWVQVCVVICISAALSYSQWSDNPTVNNTIGLASMGDFKSQPKIVTDGAGGAIITWYDTRNGIFNADIFVQRINAAGVVQWTLNGEALSTFSGDQFYPNIVADGSGGAIVTWQDFRNGTSNPDVYAQKVNASGVVQWAANGVVICSAPQSQFAANLISDGAGGAILTWADLRGGNYDIYAQRINASGTVQWTPNGVVVSNAAESQNSPEIAPDGSGGAIITWQDTRDNISTDIYAQRIDATGTALWASNGIVICSATDEQYFPTIIADGNNGAIITWQDYRTGATDIYAQRVNSTGTVQWTPNGTAICTAPSYQYYPVLTSDGANGAIITWYETRNGNQDIYAQRVSAAGTPQWTANGMPIVTSSNNQTLPTIVSDGSGGAIITWQDQRVGANNNDVYAQRINAAGSVQWASNGVAVGTSTARDEFKPTLTSDGAGGAIITWYAFDIPAYTKADIFAQKVSSNGTLGGGSPPPNPCPTLLTLVSTADDYSSGTVTKQAAAANGKIEATNLITSSANVTYEAQSIELKPGFRAENGTVFKAQVGGCN